MAEARAMTFRSAFLEAVTTMKTNGEIGLADYVRLRMRLALQGRTLQTEAAEAVIAAGLQPPSANPYADSLAWDWSKFLQIIMALIQALLDMFNN